MNLKTIQKIIGSKNQITVNFEINNIVTNSKEVKKSDVFLALNTGYLYIEEAISNGALAIITDVKNLNYNITILEVEDSKRALKSLASYYRNQYKGKVIAITGSTGKTTTKELLTHVISKKKKVLANPESKNNILGVSQTLLKLNDKYDYLILELGMNHKGEISELSYLSKPDIGIITNIGTSHIGYLGSQENIFKAKMEIIDGNPKMKLFVNGEDEYLNRIQAKLVFPTKKYDNVHSISAALVTSVALFLGCEELEIVESIQSFSGAPSRMEKHIIKNHLVIDDAYNASYESFVNGIDKLRQYQNRKIIIFGDMLELGSYGAYYHQKVLDKIKMLDNVVIVTFGQETAILNNNYHFYELDGLKHFFSEFSWNDDDIVYLKASHNLNLSSLISFFNYLW